MEREEEKPLVQEATSTFQIKNRNVVSLQFHENWKFQSSPMNCKKQFKIWHRSITVRQIVKLSNYQYQPLKAYDNQLVVSSH